MNSRPTYGKYNSEQYAIIENKTANYRARLASQDPHQGYIYQISKGAFEILDLFCKQIFDLLKGLWTFQYAAGFRGPGILIKRSRIVDLCVYAAWLRGPDISQNIQKIFQKYPKIDYRAFAFSRRHYTQRIIVPHATYNILNLFGLSKFKGGNAPLAPLIKNIPACPSSTLRVRSLIQMEFKWPKPAYAHAY